MSQSADGEVPLHARRKARLSLLKHANAEHGAEQGHEHAGEDVHSDLTSTPSFLQRMDTYSRMDESETLIGGGDRTFKRLAIPLALTYFREPVLLEDVPMLVNVSWENADCGFRFKFAYGDNLRYRWTVFHHWQSIMRLHASLKTSMMWIISKRRVLGKDAAHAEHRPDRPMSGHCDAPLPAGRPRLTLLGSVDDSELHSTTTVGCAAVVEVDEHEGIERGFKDPHPNIETASFFDIPPCCPCRCPLEGFHLFFTNCSSSKLSLLHWRALGFRH